VCWLLKEIVYVIFIAVCDNYVKTGFSAFWNVTMSQWIMWTDFSEVFSVFETSEHELMQSDITAIDILCDNLKIRVYLL
jgi:hypothetical protein